MIKILQDIDFGVLMYFGLFIGFTIAHFDFKYNIDKRIK